MTFTAILGHRPCSGLLLAGSFPAALALFEGRSSAQSREFVRAEIVNLETCRPIEHEVTVSPIVIDTPLGPFDRCDVPTRTEDRTACDRITPPNEAEFLRGDANVDGRL